MIRNLLRSMLVAALLASSFAACVAKAQGAKDEPKIHDAWVRITVPGQTVSGAYMHIKSAADLKLVKAESPVAGIVEIHNMSMKDGVMSMAAVNAVEIPAGKDVELKPGGYHIMLMQVKAPIKSGDAVPLSLTFEDGKKKRHNVTVSAQARDGNAAADHRH